MDGEEKWPSDQNMLRDIMLCLSDSVSFTFAGREGVQVGV